MARRFGSYWLKIWLHFCPYLTLLIIKGVRLRAVTAAFAPFIPVLLLYNYAFIV